MAETLKVSKSTISRWMQGGISPSLSQILELMNFGSVDFYRFVENLCGESLPSIAEQITLEKKQGQAYFQFPWIGSIFSAIETTGYQKDPTEEYLSQKAKLPLDLVRSTLKSLLESDLVLWENNKWTIRAHRYATYGGIERTRRTARYLNARVAESVENALGSPQVRHSWKTFSLNQKSYDKILQCYTEFFNEVGSIIDDSQDEADKVYILTLNLVDYDLLPEIKRTDFSGLT